MKIKKDFSLRNSEKSALDEDNFIPQNQEALTVGGSYFSPRN